ncbi:membrane protein insertase YidC, partial [Massilia arenosa]
QPGAAALPNAPATAQNAAAVPGATAAPAFQAQRITVTTDVVKATINTQGGVIERLELLKYRDKIDQAKNQVLFDNVAKHIYLGQTGLVGNDPMGTMPNHTTGFTVRPGTGAPDANGNTTLVLDAESGGVRLTKTYVFKKGDYTIDLRHDVANTGTAPVQPALYLQITHDGNKPEGDSYFNSTYTGPTLYTSQEHYQKLTFDELAKGKAEYAKKATDGWIAMSQHFFVSAFVPPQKAARENYAEPVPGETNLYRIGTRIPLGTVQPGTAVSNVAKLYSGPQDEKHLETIAPGLELVKDYGKFAVLSKPIFWVIDQMHRVIGNWGWTIVAFTVLLKLLFFPLSAAGFRSMARVKLVTPKLQAIRERYKDDPAKMNQATMELYKSEKINPLGGCLPLLVQMPVFIALYYVLQASVEMRGASWGWIPDLTISDPYFILPVLYIISMFVSTRLNPQPADPVQAKMMMAMPIIFGFMFFFFPAGLVLYWVVNNLLSIAQQWVITKKFDTGAAK